jgi:hypothetical protein
MLVGCNGFHVVRDGRNVYIINTFQSFKLEAINSGWKNIDRITSNISDKTTMSQLIEMFYLKNETGQSVRQVVRMIPCPAPQKWRDYGKT